MMWPEFKRNLREWSVFRWGAGEERERWDILGRRRR